MVRVKDVPEYSPKRAGRPHTEGTRLAALMKMRHIQVSQIAAILHVSDRTVYNLFTGRSSVPVLHLGALCDYLDVDPEDIVDDRNGLLRDQE